MQTTHYPVGKLSRPSKMPGLAFGIPAQYCKVGNKLRAVEGSVCHKCNVYGRGRFAWPVVKKAYEDRYQGIWHPNWVDLMIEQLENNVTIGVPFFRWFDSGDLQSVEMFKNILMVAEGTPQIHHWLATREFGILRNARRKYSIPNNMVVRASAAMIDGQPPWDFPHTATVRRTESKEQWAEWVQTNSNKQWFCPAPLQGNQCQDCRACWSRDVQKVNYWEK